ncbi:MAG: NAD-dependent epimerase/dehydratase family protein, partial [Acidilobus sp.]
AELALARGHDVVVVDDLSSGDVSNVPPGARLLRADVTRERDLGAIYELARRDEVAVAHLAALVSVPEARENPVRAFQVNVLGTVNVLEVARRLDAYVVVASSAAVYGDPPRLPVTEDLPARPLSAYGASKLAAEAAALAYSSEQGLGATALRLFNVYGPRMRPGPYAGVIFRFLSSAIRGEPPAVYGDGMNTRDYVYVTDVADAFLAAIERKARGVFNIGTGAEVSVLQLLDLVSAVTGQRLSPTYAPPRPGDIRRSVADITRAREGLGWSPRVRLEEGLRLTLEWLKSSSLSSRSS